MHDNPGGVSRHRTRNAVLWMLSGFIVLIAIAILQALIHYMFGGSLGSSGLLDSINRIFNIFSILAGLIGFILIPVGIIIGIVKLSDTKR